MSGGPVGADVFCWAVANSHGSVIIAIAATSRIVENPIEVIIFRHLSVVELTITDILASGRRILSPAVPGRAPKGMSGY